MATIPSAFVAPKPAASVSVTPADPVGTTNTALTQMGLAIMFTPAASGLVLAVITAAVHATGTAEPCFSAGKFGTGTAPVNGASGTAGTKFGVGVEADYFTTTGSTAEATPVTFQQILPLTVGTPYWFDVAIATNNALGTAIATNITVTLIELGQ